MIRFGLALGLLLGLVTSAIAQTPGGGGGGGSGITQLTGDVTAGPGSGSQASTASKVNGVAYPPGPSTNTVPVVTGANTTTYEAVPNAALAFSSMILAGHTVSLGGTQAFACGDLSNDGTACTANTGTSGATVPFLNGTNVWSGVQSYNDGDLSLNGSTSGASVLHAPATGGGAVTLPAGNVALLATNGNGGSLTGLAYSQLPGLLANQLLGSLTATTPSGLSVPPCSGASSALTWTSGTGFGCNTISAGSSAFSALTGGTNTSAAMVVGAGASLSFTSTGIVNANQLGGVGLLGGTLTNGGFCTYASTGTLLNCNTGSTGSGPVVLGTGPTIAGGALSGTFTGTPTFSGNLTFSGVPNFTGTLTGTQTQCLGLSSGNALVASAGACGTGGGAWTITDGTHSVSGVVTLTTGAGLVVGGSTGSATLNTTVADTTHTVSATVANIGGQDDYNGSSLTATLATLAAGQTALVTDQNASILTINNNSQTVNGLPLSTSLHTGGFYGYTFNSTTSQISAWGFPGFDTITANAVPKFSDASGATTASSISDAGSGVTIGGPTGGAKGLGTLNVQNGVYANGVLQVIVTPPSAGALAYYSTTGAQINGAAITANVLPKSGGTGAPSASSITDNGGVTIGSPTGGAQGAGTLNAGGLFVNGVAVAGASGVGVQSGQSPSGIGDNATALPSGHYVYATNVAMTAARSHNLPDSVTQGVGDIEVIDSQQTVTGTNTLTVAAAGTDTLNGVTNGTAVLSTAGAAIALHNDGAGHWTTTWFSNLPPTSANKFLATNGSGAPTWSTLGSNVATAMGNALSSAGGLTTTVASGTATLGTSAIASGACATVVTVSATGVATTDVVQFSYNGDPTAVTGYGASATGAVLSIYPYPTANNVNVKVCNSTTSSITPGAMTLNFRVAR